MVFVGALVLLVGAVVAAPLVGRRMKFFEVRRIEITGLHYLHESDVLAALDLDRNRSVFDPLDSLRILASQIGGVRAASVERRLPGTIRIAVFEEVPVALALFENRLVPVDLRGAPLPFDPSSQAVSLPIADSGSAAAGLLAMVLTADHSLYDEIEIVQTDGTDLILIIGGHKIRLRPEADAETLQGVVAVREYLSEQGIRWHEIDARYNGRVFVKKGVA